ncbi:MAG: ABC transporter permease [Rhodothermales bacterium]
MFDLEKAIAAWRHPYTFAKAFSARDIDEMERHLRDQVEELVQAGASPESAFRQAVAEMGPLDAATREYGKVWWRKVRHRGAVSHEARAMYAMARNDVRLAYRNLWRDRVPSAINILGLSIALGCCITVYVFLATWYSLDSFHAQGERLLLAQHVVERNGQSEIWGSMPMPLGPALEADIPQVERAVRINRAGVSIRRGDELFDEAVTFVDIGFFDALSFPLASGTPEALRDPSAVLLSEPMARRLFGEADPVGETLAMTFDRRVRRTVTVAGVLQPFPANNGFRFDMLMGFDTQYDLGLAERDDWRTQTSGLFVLARTAGDAASIAEQMNRYLPVQHAANSEWPIQSFGFDTFTAPSSDAFRIRGRISEPADPALTVLLVLIAAFMLALSVFNYINITLGSAARRLKEIALRKVIGGNRRQLIAQFMTENVLLCLMALAIGIALSRLAMVPLFNATFVLNLDLRFWEHLGFWAFLVGLLAFVGIASGAYPALYIASFEPVAIFRGRQRLADNAWFTRACLTFQFVLAFITVIMGVVLTLNSRYLIRQDWGYDPSHTLVFELEDISQYQPFRDALAQHAGVLSVGGAAEHIGRTPGRAELRRPDGETTPVLRYDVDSAYVQTLGLRLREGRLFDPGRTGEAGRAVVVNDRFVRAMGWANPLGQTVRLDTTVYAVVGVVEDFSFFLLAEPQPAALVASPATAFPYLTVRVRDDALAGVEAYAETVWKRLYPESTISKYRQATVFDDTYQQYNSVTQTFNYIAGLALLIACMGLFGLASQNIARRMKEISIRKVVGASLGRLTILINRRFLVQLAVAAGIATALCILGINLLLGVVRESVPIAHMPLTPLPFLVAYALVLGTTALAIGSQWHKIAGANPADVLRGDG